MKNKKGITLVALIITIIVLLILAGISINAIVGDHGIISKAQYAKDSNKKADEKEILKTSAIQAIGNSKNGEIEISQLQNIVNAMTEENNCEIFEAGDEIRAFFEETKRWYVIDEEANVTELEFTEETEGIYIGEVETKTLVLDGAMVFSPEATSIPSTKNNLNYIWTSSNPEVATVSIDGIVKCGTEFGTTTITCKGANGTQATCEVTTTAKIVYTNNGNTNTTIDKEEGSAANPTIPVGYSAITTEASTWNLSSSQTETDLGLVIMDNRGNQFVWIPVPNVIYDSTTEITSGTYTPMSVLKDGSSIDYKGIFYSFEGTTASRYDTYNNVEPSVVSADYITGDETKGFALIRKYIKGMAGKTDDEIKTAWSSQIQEEYNKLINQTSKYGGFWVSRYEVSYDLNTNRLASIAGAKAASPDEENTKTWYGIYQKIKDYSNSDKYGSSMIWGSQYDAIMNFLARNDIPVGTVGVISGVTLNTSRITGNINFIDKLNNIYDLSSCSDEWTQEAYLYAGGRFLRNPAMNNLIAKYGFEVPERTNSDNSSRITLYMN